MPAEQISLFSDPEWRSLGRSPLPEVPLNMSVQALTDWKQRVAAFQQQVTVSAPCEQGQLFSAASLSSAASQSLVPPLDPDTLDPFSLPQQNTEFWRWTVRDRGNPAFYFVIDYELPLLLYVGETITSNQRWKGEHDCKRYLMQYRQAHYQHQLPSTLGIAFYRNAPASTRERQRLESALIYKWRSPFNKENWSRWNTPFVSEKLS
jgi:hypothetical protein